MAVLDATYNATNQRLQQHIDTALLELRNTSSKAFALADVAMDIDIPEPPQTNVDGPEPPESPDIPETPGVPDVAMPTPSVSATFPTAPTVGSERSWSGPRRPQAPSQFKAFFKGDPDTPEEVVERANEAVDAWVRAYFPNIVDCFKNVPEEWVCDVISGVRPLGNSEQAITIAWQRAKQNEYAQLESERKTIPAEFASRGFKLPPGAMVSMVRRSYERFADSAAAINREAALKDIDVQTQLLTLAVETASRLKLGLATEMARYYSVVAGIQDQAGRISNERARIVADAETSFISALNNYSQINQEYNRSLAQLSLDRDRARGDLYNVASQNAARQGEFQVQSARLQLAAAESRLSAAVERARAMNDSARTKATVYQTETQAWASKVSAEVSIAQFEVEKYKAQVHAAVAEASAKASPGAASALSGIAAAFGNIGATAAEASGTLVAQIEGF